MGVLFFLAILFAIFMSWYNQVYGKSSSAANMNIEEDPYVNQMNLYSRKSDLNIQITYAYLAGWLLRKNSQDSKAKIDFVRMYFQRNFQKYTKEVQLELINAMKYETNIRSVSKWISRHLSEGAERIQIIDFLFDVAKVDGNIIDREFVAIVRLAELIGVRASYIEKKLKEYNDQKFRTYTEASNFNPSGAKRTKAILELQLTEGFDENQLKRAYRKMAKRYHPDAQTVGSASERELANEKFLQIQEAYEYLSGTK